MQQEAVKFCCEATGQDGENVPFVVNALLNYLCCEFENGHSVDFGQDFSVFSVKKRDQILPPGSPRTPKAPKYVVIFKAGSNLKRRLKKGVQDGTLL